MSRELYKFNVRYKDIRNGGIGNKTVTALSVREAKEVFYSKYAGNYSIISCVRGESCKVAQERAEKETSSLLSNMLWGGVLAAGAAVVAGLMDKNKKS